MKFRLIAIAACLALAPLSAYCAPVNLDARTTLYVDPAAPAPVQKAAADLESDWQKVFGQPIHVVTDPKNAGATTLWIAMNASLPKSVTPPSGWEQFSVQALANPWPGSSTHEAILLTGSDMRGTMYAIYEFSQKFLGVDPMYFWTDLEPSHKTSVQVPSDFVETQGPVFHYRGFFLNDEDMLTGWAPGEKTDGSGIALSVMNKVYETILRLKGDMVVPGTWIFPNDPQVKLVGERGLIMTQHHAIPLGVNVARWPAGVPYNFTTHPEIIERAWKDAVASYDPNQEILWAVGLRGLSDTSYASMDPSVVGNDKALGALINKAIDEQMAIVRAVHPDAKFVTDFWQEGARLVQEGDLKIPKDAISVWADTGYGDPQDKGQVAAGQGVYYHVAMLNGRANQLSEMVPVERIDSELGRYIKAGATAYMLLNTSDIRAVTMTTKAVMDVSWAGLPDGSTDDKYYREWATREFGAKSAPALAKVYEEYFKAPAVSATDPMRMYGDQLYHSEVRQMLMDYMISPPYYSIPSQSPKWTPIRIMGMTGPGYEPPPGMPAGLFSMTPADYLSRTIKTELQQCADAQPRWDKTWKDAVAAEPLITPSRLPFYRYEMLTMIAINKDSNHILFLISNAIQDAQNGQTAKAHQEAEDALKQFDEIHQLEAGGEYGKWKNWFRGDWLTGVDQTRDLVQTFVKYLDDPNITLPPPVNAGGWEGYYHILHYEGNRSVDVH